LSDLFDFVVDRANALSDLVDVLLVLFQVRGSNGLGGL
jgi:hypothetical protein